MIEDCIDLIKAIIEATVSGRLEWKYYGTWPDIDNEVPYSNYAGDEGATFKSTWEEVDFKIYREHEITRLRIESPEVSLTVSDKILPQMKHYLNTLFYEIRYICRSGESAREKLKVLMSSLTLSLLG